MEPPVLIVPGWTNSGPEHWQSRWEKAHPTWRRVEQGDWDSPEPQAWLSALTAAVAETTARTGELPLLVGHSLGALLIAAWAAAQPDARAAAALLVAPPDVERSDTPSELVSFAPMPRARLPFPSVLAASRTDPYLSWNRAVEFAAAWGSSLHDCGAVGHLNTAAGFGAWPQGERLLAALMQRTA
jgi:predicted alpha/beta hydrolase family esterase